MQVVYIDVLFILNLIINYFILLAVSQILHRNDKRLRLLFGAGLGALYASLMFFPQIAFLYTAGLKLVFSMTIVAVSFKRLNIRSFFKLLICFYITSMLFGGIIFAVRYFAAPPGLDVRNGVVYVNMSPLLLILSGAGCYIVIKLLSRYLHRDVHTTDIYTVEIAVDGISAKMPALLDNGNDLCDAISGYPVIIAEYRHVEILIPQQLRTIFRSGKVPDTANFDVEGWRKRIRFIPYGSVGNTGGILMAFRPDKLTVAGADIATSNVLVAVTNNRLSSDELFNALLNPHLFHEVKTETAPVPTR
jgi:stage II sporulation protein GA (sporulation sigma-E factor processing peptidase)